MLHWLLALATVSAQAAWNPNEASLLLPLPQTIENPLWQPATLGGQGALIPPRFWPQLPPIVATSLRFVLYEKALRVIAVRLDPCFIEGFGPQPCRHQIRLVWQPMVREGTWSTHDAALHTFYTLNENEWTAFVAEWEKLRARFTIDPTQPLQVHPLLSAQGYTGEYWAAMSTVLLREIGEARLTRITAMTVNPHQNVWRFTGFDIVGGELRRMAIPGCRRPFKACRARTATPQTCICK